MTEDCETGVSLEEFVNQEKRILDDFAEDWKTQHSACPEDWPMKMSPEIWDDEYRLFHDQEG